VKVLVVGGAGYIGSHAARALRRAGIDVLIYDNLSTGFNFLAKGFEMVVGDIQDRDSLLQVVKQTDAIMHFAAHAYVGESVVNPRKYYRNNLEGGLSLLNTIVDAGKKNMPVIFSSTCAVYGVPKKMPLTEDHPLAPINPYGVSKFFFEQALESYDTAYGLKSARLRYFNAAGADEDGEAGECHDPEPHLIPLALAAAGRGELQIFGDDYPTPDGTCIRDYIDVADLAEAHVMALKHLMAGNPSFTVNLGTGQGSSVKEVITAVEEVTGKKVPTKVVPRRAGDPPALVADPTQAQQLLRWKARRSLRDSVTSAWKWMQKRGK
jgi:UDP-glucose-4-epimerase GalE